MITRVLESLLSAKSTVAQAIRHRNWASLWGTCFIPNGLPVLLGLILGPLLGLFIVDGAPWLFVFALPLLVPLIILFNAYPLVTAIIWLLVMPFFLATPTVAGRYAYWMLHRAMIPVGLGIVILSHLLKAKKYHPVRLGPAELMIGIFVGMALVSTLLLQPNVTTSLIWLYDRIFIPYCMYLLMRLATPRRKDIQRLLMAAFFMAVSQSVIGLLSWFAPQVLPPEWLGFQGVRTTGTLRQPGPYTAVLVFSTALLFQAAMNRKPGLLRSGLLLTFGLGTVCVFLSLSRGSWLGGVLTAIGLLVLFPKPTLRMAIILLVVMIALQEGVLSTQLSAASERMNQQNTIQSRVAVANAAFTMIKLKPFFGWGYGNLERYVRPFLKRLGGNLTLINAGLASHNTYLTIAAEMGLVGFFIYVFPFIWWLILTIRVLPRMPKRGLWSRSLLIVLWLIVMNHVVVSNFIDMRHFAFALTLWWMTLGLIANMVFPHMKPGDIGVPRWVHQKTG
jgi:O-antigen ligase